MSTRRPPRLPRELEELVTALREHTALLDDYIDRAFEQGEEAYLGEIAAKLRVLVYKGGRNRPLLFDLMREFQIGVDVTINGPPQFEVAPGIRGGDSVPIETWLGLLAFAAVGSNGEILQLTKKELIAVWAQQSGAAHEDGEHDEVFVRLRKSGVVITGHPSDDTVLLGIARKVLSAARIVLDEIDRRAAQ